MLVYVAIAGPSPSVLRAFWMGALMLLSRCLGRKIHMPAALCLTMFIMLFINPLCVFDLGFQLSYFSTAGMILGAGQFDEMLKQGIPRCPAWIRTILSATIVAQACVLPLQLYCFRQLTPYCLIANVVVSPLVSPITILGFASSMLYVFESLLHMTHWLSGLLDKICYWPLELMMHEVGISSSLPFAQMQTGRPQLPALVLYYVILLCFPVLYEKKKIGIWAFLFIMALGTVIGTMSN
jgi:competence protein ComEC